MESMKRKLVKPLLAFMSIAILMIFPIGQAFSQQTSPNILSKLVVPAPTSAEIAKYTDIPVSLYTGTPGISVPLYEINTGFLTLPLTLSYHASGIRVNENASSVGLGWTINAGGAITRSVLGMPDDGSYQDIGGLDWIGGGFDLNDPDDYRLLPTLYENTIDGVPDLYMYNFNGYNGRFIEADQIRQLPQTNVSITKGMGNQEWTIVTENGTIYTFAAREISQNKSGTSASSSTSAWYLTKILAPNRNDSIVFTYISASYEVEIGTNFSMDLWQTGAGYIEHGGSSRTTYVSRVIEGKQLTRIEFNGGSVDFDVTLNVRQDLGAPLVRGMTVTNKEGKIIKSISFQHDYFNSDKTDAKSKRLKLTDVLIYPAGTTDATRAEKYSFSYNTTPLPSRGSFSQDHWGYYNNANNSTLIPTWTNCHDNFESCLLCATRPYTYTFKGANREPKAQYVKAGILEKITYPTGGYTTFEYEAHDAPPVTPTSTVVNDVWAEAFAYNSGSSSTFAKDSSDEYTIPAGSGNVCAVLYGAQGVALEHDDDAAQINHAATKVILKKKGSTTSVVSLTFPYSSTGDYDKVATAELEAGQTYYVYVETRGPNFTVSGNLNMKFPETIANGNRLIGGCRIKKMVFHDPVTGKDQVTKYEYRQPDNPDYSSGNISGDPEYTMTIFRFVDRSPTPCDQKYELGTRLMSNSIFNLGAGSHVGYSYVKEIHGENGENGSTLYKFTNDWTGLFGEFDASWRRGQLLAQTDYNSAGKILKTITNHYKFDNRNYAIFEGRQITSYAAHVCASTTAYNPAYPVFTNLKTSTFPSEWMYKDITEEKIYTSGSGTESLSNTQTFYYDNPQHKALTRVVSTLSDGTETTQNFKYTADFSIPTGTLPADLTAIKDMQDKHMYDVVEQYTQQIAPGTTTSTTVAGVYNQYISSASSWGKVTLLDKQYRMETAVPVNNFVPAYLSGSNLVKDSRYVPETSISKYDGRYNISEAEQRGNQSAYLWDVNRQYIMARVANAGQSDIAYCGFEADGKGNWSFTGTSTADATSPTGRKCYNLGQSGGNISRAGLISSKTYIVSYWTRNTSPYTLAGTKVGYPVKGRTVNGWTYFEHKISGQSTITISGAGFIDELRLYPETAQMETYTYSPLVGVTSQCDTKNRVSYYEYDDFNRLKLIKDQHGKILKQYDYQYQKPITQ
ncbi:hypothetical protein [Chitinophaga japonensis]|uniref:YD repeat-containing protein n=1 Tax=Chitinophaga japonensis TaxID=104662 RepID=A0A562SZB7_CHIJA|nr:hypothetical protein [Chitinophaga japonensis]TWI86602.1 hypothetical protein LX66_3864 [Chitinophaga japonensis]